jgi:hypothetical protein
VSVWTAASAAGAGAAVPAASTAGGEADAASGPERDGDRPERHPEIETSTISDVMSRRGMSPVVPHRVVGLKPHVSGRDDPLDSARSRPEGGDARDGP